MKYFKVNYVITLLFVFTVFSFTQNISVQETELQNLEKLYAVEKSKLDSLNTYLQKQLRGLDEIKRQSPRDNDKISVLMVDAHSVTKKADKQEKIVNVLGVQIKKQRLLLYKNFTSKIDSLTRSFNNLDGIQKRKTELELRELNQKRAQVSPALPLSD